MLSVIDCAKTSQSQTLSRALPLKRRRGESGIALLFVFVMAAAIAIALYIEIPRVAFESQRAQEELLVDRGEQYARAIRVFVHRNGRYPQNIEELENFNNVRSLRKRYADPMTGKDEWRIIHIAAPGMFTDSLVNKPKDDKQKRDKGTAGIITGEGPAPGSTPADSDQPQSRPVQPGQLSSGQAGQSSQSVPAGTDSQPPVMNSAPGGMAQTGAPNQAERPVQIPNSLSGGSAGGSQLQQSQAVYGGVAGIASMSTKKGIKIYNGHRKYNEWEFIYDVTKDLPHARSVP